MADLLATRLVETHPQDAAEALAELDAPQLAEFLASLSARAAGAVLAFLPPTKLAQSLGAMEPKRASALVAQLPTAVAVATLQLIDDPIRRQIQDKLPFSVYSALRLMQNFPAGSIGTVMETQVLTLPKGISVEDALRRIRRDPRSVQHAVYVLDDDHRLLGQVAVRDVILAKRRSKLDRLIQQPVTFTAQTALSVIEQHPIWTTDTVVAVTDRKGIFLGVLRQEQMVSALAMLASDPRAPSTTGTLLDLADLLWSAAGSLIFPSQPEADKTREQQP